jgi:hypothetical protein
MPGLATGKQRGSQLLAGYKVGDSEGWGRVKAWLERWIPAVEASGSAPTPLSLGEFEELMAYFLRDCGFRLRRIEGTACVLELPRKMVAGANVFKGLFGTPEAEMYRTMKSQYRCALGEDGTLRVTAFEHVAALGREHEALRAVMARRLAGFLAEAEELIRRKRERGRF